MQVQKLVRLFSTRVCYESFVAVQGAVGREKGALRLNVGGRLRLFTTHVSSVSESAQRGRSTCIRRWMGSTLACAPPH